MVVFMHSVSDNSSLFLCRFLPLAVNPLEGAGVSDLLLVNLVPLVSFDWALWSELACLRPAFWTRRAARPFAPSALVILVVY